MVLLSFHVKVSYSVLISLLLFKMHASRGYGSIAFYREELARHAELQDLRNVASCYVRMRYACPVVFMQ
jgi:hypothetical protein